MKDTLIVYRDWWEVINSLPQDKQLESFVAICSYAFDNVIPEDPMVLAITALMRATIDRDKDKFNDISNKRAKAGRKGGINRKANASKRKQNKQMQANASDGEKLAKEIGIEQANVANAYRTCSDEIQSIVDEVESIAKQMQAKQANASDNNINIINNNIYNKNKNIYARTREDFFKQLRESEIFWEDTAMSLHCAPERLKLMLPDFHSEIKATDVRHNDFADYRKHFFSWARKALQYENNSNTLNMTNKQKYEPTQQDKYSKRRGSNSAARSAEDYTDTI